MLARPAMAALPMMGGACSALHGHDRMWPLTNCYVDLWVEILHAWGHNPVDSFAFCAAQAFEGDHFTFFKPPAADIEALHGIRLEELALFDDFEQHLLVQTRRGRVPLVEVDGFYLSDTRTTSYQREHTKTTIGVVEIDPEGQTCRYFHNSGYYMLEGADYHAVMRLDRRSGLPLFPYAEMIWQGPRPDRSDIHAIPLDQLRHHLARRPGIDPIGAFRTAFPEQLETILARDPELFHAYTFNTVRQLGSCHDFLGDFLRWMNGYSGLGLTQAAACCTTISATAKTLQLRTARLVARRRVDACDELFDTLQDAHARLHRALDAIAV